MGVESAQVPWKTNRQHYQDARFLHIGSSDLDALRDPERHAAWITPDTMEGMPGYRVLKRPDPFLSRLLGDAAMSEDCRRLCSKSPFVFAADLLETSALCWDQMINFLHHFIQQLPPPGPNNLGERVGDLGETKALVDSGILYFREIIQFIDARDKLGWS